MAALESDLGYLNPFDLPAVESVEEFVAVNIGGQVLHIYDRTHVTYAAASLPPHGREHFPHVLRLVPLDCSDPDEEAITSPETAVPDERNADGVAVLRATPAYARSPRAAEYVAEFMQIREDFVKARGWQTGNINGENDDYDSDPSTLYVIAANDDKQEGAQVVAGARFTQVSSLEGSLTFHMMRGCLPMREEARKHKSYGAINAAGQEGRLFDMTRLVTPDSGVSHHDALDGIWRIFGAGYAATRAEGHQESHAETTWIFIIEPKLLQLLQQVGIPVEVLATGKVSDCDQEDSILCAVHPETAFAEVQKLADGPKSTSFARWAYRTIADAASGISRTDSMS